MTTSSKTPNGTVPGWELLQEGNYTRAVVEPHVNIMGDWFWVFLLFSGLFALYAKTENFTTTMIVGALVSAGVQALLPTQTYAMMSLAILFGISAAIYQFLVGR